MPVTQSQTSERAWTAHRFESHVRRLCGGAQMVVLANREPVRHEFDERGRITVQRSGSGLVTALEPVVSASHGIWVGHGSGSADRATADTHDRVRIADGSREYRLRRVWLDPEEERRYYYGFANEGLWPLCHRVHVRPVFRAADYTAYMRVNDRFADAVCEEAPGAPVVMVQDYHFALAPAMIRSRLPASTIVSFWHIPWPTPRDFEICPWGPELIRGLLGSTVLGFHTEADRRHFLETVAEFVGEARVDADRGMVSVGERTTAVGAYPISVEWPNPTLSQTPSVDLCRDTVRQELGIHRDSRLIVGIDRLDYTKGLVEKVAAFERLLERHPELMGRATFLQVAEPSRVCLPAYRALRRDLYSIVNRVNSRFGDVRWTPIVLRESHHNAIDVCTILRAADVCFVGSLHDGMNLVAKEFVAVRDDNRGVLVLSAFAGAARQLTEAVVVNPYATDACAEGLAHALGMDSAEQARRMCLLRAIVADTNSYWWAATILEDGTRLATRFAERYDPLFRSWQPAHTLAATSAATSPSSRSPSDAWACPGCTAPPTSAKAPRRFTPRSTPA